MFAGAASARSADVTTSVGAALLGVVLPVVGEAQALPLGSAALVTGCVGIRIAEREARPGVRRALAGALAGMAAVAAVLFAMIAGEVRPSD